MPRRTSALTFAFALALTSTAGVAQQQQQATPQQQSSHAEEAHGSMGDAAFDRFHDLLHPLQHDAVPQNDYARIRRDGRDLVLAGRRITNNVVPATVADTAKFCDEQARFELALKEFDRAARRKDDAELKRSFASVHDTFEELASLIRRR